MRLLARDGSLIFDTRIDSKGFKDGMDKLKSAGTKAIKAVGKAVVATGAAIGGLGVAATRVGMDFEKAMSRVGALSGATGKELEALEKTALELGKSTVFSASQAAEGMQYLAMAGFEVNDTIAAMPGLLNVAAAGQLELGTAADITSNILSGFGIAAEETGKVADVLTKAFTSSNTSLESLGETMKYAAPIASAAGFGLEEVAAAAGMLGDAGIQGGQAGTTLRGVMLRLVNPPKQAADALNALGVSITDSAGEMKPLAEIVTDLEKATEGMTDAQRTAIISQIAGQQAASGLLAIMDMGGDKLAEFTEELENAGGTAERVANEQIDNLAGDIELLKSALEFTGIMIYQGFDKPLRDVTQTVTGYIERIGNAIEAHDNLEDGLAAAIDIIGEMLADGLNAFADFAPKLLDMARNLIIAFIDGIRVNKSSLVEATTEIILSLLNSVFEIIPMFLELGIEIIQELGRGIVKSLPSLIDAAKESISWIIIMITENLPILMDLGVQIIMMLIEGITSFIPELITLGMGLLVYLTEAILDNIPVIIDAAVSIIDGLIEGLAIMLPEILEMGLTIILMLIEGIIGNIDQLIQTTILLVETIVEFILDNLDMIIDASLEIVMAIVEGLLDNIDLIIEATIELVLALIEAIIKMLPQLVEAGIQIVFGLINGLLNNLPALIGAAITLVSNLIGAIIRFIPQIIVLGIQLVGELAGGLLKAVPTVLNAGRNIILSVIKAMGAALSGAATIGKNLVQGLWNGINNAKDWVLGKIKDFGSSIMKGIKNIFGIKSPSTLMRDEIGKNIALGIGVGFEIEADGLKKDVDKEMLDLAKSMKATVDMESSSVGRSVTASSGITQRVMESTEDNSDNSVKISGNTFVIREEADIEKVAVKLDELRKRKTRSRGVVTT